MTKECRWVNRKFELALFFVFVLLGGGKSVHSSCVVVLLLTFRLSPLLYWYSLFVDVWLCLFICISSLLGSMQYYYGLQSKGVECKCLIYDMSHALSDNVEQKANMWVNVVRWFMDHSLCIPK